MDLKGGTRTAMTTEQHIIPCGPLLVAENDIANLKEWQKNQNGSIKELTKKVDFIKTWLIGLLGSALLAIILLVLNLVIKR